MIEEIKNYINGEDYPDEIPKRIMGLFEREHADLLAEVKRLREENERFRYQLIEAIGLVQQAQRMTKEGRRYSANKFERQTNEMLGREMIE